MAYKVCIDFGSNYITIFVKGMGVVLKEPSVIIGRKTGRTLELIETGTKAIRHLGRLNKEDRVIYPINEGAVTNIEACALMIKDYLNKVTSKSLIRHKLEALVIISSGLTIAERRDIEIVMSKAGCTQSIMIESPYTIFIQGKKDNQLIIIIGADLTEIAIVNDEGIISGCSIDIAGEAFNKAIADYIAIKYRVQIGAYLAEKVKTSIGSMYENDMSALKVSGKDLNENSPKSIEITSADVRKAITPLIEKLIEVVDSVMCYCPDNIMEEVYGNGLHLAGGSAEIQGLNEYLSVRLKMGVELMSDPINAVAIGGGALIEDYDSLSRLLSLNKVS